MGVIHGSHFHCNLHLQPRAGKEGRLPSSSPQEAKPIIKLPVQRPLLFPSNCEIKLWFPHFTPRALSGPTAPPSPASAHEDCTLHHRPQSSVYPPCLHMRPLHPHQRGCLAFLCPTTYFPRPIKLLHLCSSLLLSHLLLPAPQLVILSFELQDTPCSVLFKPSLDDVIIVGCIPISLTLAGATGRQPRLSRPYLLHPFLPPFLEALESSPVTIWGGSLNL